MCLRARVFVCEQCVIVMFTIWSQKSSMLRCGDQPEKWLTTGNPERTTIYAHKIVWEYLWMWIAHASHEPTLWAICARSRVSKTKANFREPHDAKRLNQSSHQDASGQKITFTLATGGCTEATRSPNPWAARAAVCDRLAAERCSHEAMPAGIYIHVLDSVVEERFSGVWVRDECGIECATGSRHIWSFVFVGERCARI